MQKYLLTVLLKDSLKDEEQKELLSLIKADFDNLLKEDLWGQRSLAYPIQKQDKAFYAHFEFELEPSKTPAIDKKLKLNEDIVRYLLVKAKIVKKAKDKSNKNKKVAEKSKEKEEAVVEVSV